MLKFIRLGTRKSKLALVQAEQVAALLRRVYTGMQVNIVPISTPGDTDKTTPLSQLGGKGVFISTLETALLDNVIDIAVHSLKDVTSESSDRLVLSGFLKPEACEDAMVISKKHSQSLTLQTLPKNPRIGTGSLRRKGLLAELRADAICVDIRGNVETRIQRCDDELDAVILSKAGLLRLGLESRISETLNPSIFIPAPGQGVITLQTRRDDSPSTNLCQTISDNQQSLISSLEMTLLRRLGLGCQFPFGTYTTILENTATMTCFWANEDLSSRRFIAKIFSLTNAEESLDELYRSILND